MMWATVTGTALQAKRRRRVTTSNVPLSAADRGYVMGNMNSMVAHMMLRIYTNAFEQARGFCATDSAVDPTPVDSDGYPTGACDLVLSTDSSGLGGNLTPGDVCLMQWTGASGALSNKTGATITDKSTVGGVTTATLTVTSGTVTLAVTPPLADLKIMRPGLSLSEPSRWTSEAIDYFKQFNGLRFMKCGMAEWDYVPEDDYTLTWSGGGTVSCNALYGTVSNGGASPCVWSVKYGGSPVLTGSGITAGHGMTMTRSGFPAGSYQIFSKNFPPTVGPTFVAMQTALTWADRPSLSRHSAAASMCRETVGMPFEDQIALTNAVYAAPGSKLKCVWLHMHATADDTFITTAATLIRDTLNSSIKAIIALSNETWNSIAYISYWYQYWLATAEVAANPSSVLAYDGASAATTWRQRFHARRTKEMSALCQAVFTSEFGTRCRIALEGQLVDTSGLLGMLEFLRINYGEPSSYVHVLSPAVYSFITAENVRRSPDAATIVNYLDTDLTNGRPAQAAQAALWNEYAVHYGIPDVSAYESAPAVLVAVGTATTLREVSFTSGSVAPSVGGTITQGANSATVQRIILSSGSWGGGNAAGKFVINTPSPGSFSAGALTAGATATLSGAQVVSAIDAADMANVAAALNSSEIETHIQSQLQDWWSKGGKEICYFNIGVDQPYSDSSISSNANNFWHAQFSSASAPPTHKLAALQAAMNYNVPTDAQLSFRNMAPGTFDVLAYVRASVTATSWPANSTIGWVSQPVDTPITVYATFVADTTKTFTLTPQVAAHGNAVFRILIDDVEVWNSGVMTTGTRPSTAVAVPQTPFTAAITAGKHRIRFECTPKTATEQYGWGPLIAA